MLTYLFVIVFFICCVLQFWFGKRLHTLLARGHPGEWRRVSPRLWFDPMLALYAWRREGRALGDPILTKVLDQYRLMQIVAYSAWLGLAIRIFRQVSN